MPRTRSPDRDRAFELWRDSDGKLQNREIAKQLGIPEKTVSGWKVKDKWSQSLNGVLQNTPKEGTEYSKKKTEQQKRKKNVMRKVVASVEANEELTEKQRLFCIHYANSNNATQSYLKAYDCDYGTANVNGYKLLVNTRVKAEIKRLKEIMRAEIDFDVLDLLHYCLKVVGADIGDYLSFGQREEPIVTNDGPVIDQETGDMVTEQVNYVALGESSRLDTSLISEIKQGKSGVSIKLADKKWAWEQLIKYFDLLPDKERRKLDQARLEIERDKVQIMRDKASGPEAPPEPLVLQPVYGKPERDGDA